MLELEMDTRAFGKVGWGIFIKRFIPLFLLTLISSSGAALIHSDYLVWSIILVIISLGLSYKWVRVIYKNLDVLSLGKTLILTLTRDGATGLNALKKSKDFKKSELLKVTITKDQNGTLVSFYLNRQRKKFVGRVNAVAHDYYLTEDSIKAVKRFLTSTWGGNLKTKTDGVRESYIWKPEKA
jgi:hypothetical protein